MFLEGQNFARKNHHRDRPRRAGAAELASVDALDSDGQFALPSAGARSAWAGRSIFWKA